MCLAPFAQVVAQWQHPRSHTNAVRPSSPSTAQACRPPHSLRTLIFNTSGRLHKPPPPPDRLKGSGTLSAAEVVEYTDMTVCTPATCPRRQACSSAAQGVPCFQMRIPVAAGDEGEFTMRFGTAERPGKAAATHVQVLSYGTYKGKPVTKVGDADVSCSCHWLATSRRLHHQLLLQPITGRTHQLRMHTMAIGHPIGKWGRWITERQHNPTPDTHCLCHLISG